jgi:hypothetical protein
VVKPYVTAIVVTVGYKQDTGAAKDYKKHTNHTYMAQYAKAVFGKKLYYRIFMQVANVFHIHFERLTVANILRVAG